MENIRLNVYDMNINLLSKPNILTYNKNKILLEFIFSDEWQGLKTAIFNVDGVAYSMLIDDEDKCEIPEICYTSKSLIFKIGVICGDLVTTNNAIIRFNESCYVPNVTIPPPTNDVYTQIIDKINDIETGVSNKTSEFMINVNGVNNTWINDIKGYCVTTTNKYESIPAVFSNLVNDNNSNLGEYYGVVSTEGVLLPNDISSKVDKIAFDGTIKLLENQWYGTEFRLIAHSLDCHENMYLGEEYNFTPNKCVELGIFGVPLGGKRSSDFSPRPFFTTIRDSETNETIKRDSWVLKLQMKSDSTQDIITNRSHILITFYDK